MALHYIGADARAAKVSQLQTSFQNLAESANTLNKESDKFSGTIGALDEALNRLSPGVSAWVNVSSCTPNIEEPWSQTEERLGFAKTNNRWGLSLSRVDINLNAPDEFREEVRDTWLFNDAPRNLRLRAVDHIPDVIAKLAEEADRVAKQVAAGAEIASELLRSVNAAVAAKGKQR